jgi:hypothetical protein
MGSYHQSFHDCDVTELLISVKRCIFENTVLNNAPGYADFFADDYVVDVQWHSVKAHKDIKSIVRVCKLQYGNGCLCYGPAPSMEIQVPPHVDMCTELDIWNCNPINCF